MTNCQSKAKSVEHSNPEVNPEMFKVYGNGRERRHTGIVCLAHAVALEAKGHHVEIIPT